MTKNSIAWQSEKVIHYSKEIYRKVPGYQLIHHLTAMALKEKLSDKKKGNVLIVGAGGGEELLQISSIIPEVHLTALDPSEKMLNIAQSRTPNNPSIHYINGYLEDQELSRKFDAIVCVLTFHFIENDNKQAFLNKINSYLREGASLFLVTMIKDRNHSFYFDTWALHMKEHGGSLQEINRFNNSIYSSTHPICEELLIQLLHSAKFTTVTSYVQSLFFKGFVCTKTGENE